MSRRYDRADYRRTTLVLHGANDPLVPVEGGIDTAAHISGAELKIIPAWGTIFPPRSRDPGEGDYPALPRGRCA